MTIKLVTYNIDGLPETIDLKDLPWFLKPFSWLYKLIKGTTVLHINDNINKWANMIEISQYLCSTNADIIAVQEDFNYHNELIVHLLDYNSGTYAGEISANTIKWFPVPHFKADGLNLFTKGTIKSEKIVPWDTSYGYFTHANDKLTKKGFREYCINLNGVDIDVYVLHMDADFYDPDKCPNVAKDILARREQLQQLVDFIRSKNSYNPIIIIGDTNSTKRYEWDEDNINATLVTQLGAKEALCNTYDVDRVFYIDGLTHNIEVKEAYYADVGLSDHKPFVVTLEIRESE